MSGVCALRYLSVPMFRCVAALSPLSTPRHVSRLIFSFSCQFSRWMPLPVSRSVWNSAEKCRTAAFSGQFLHPCERVRCHFFFTSRSAPTHTAARTSTCVWPCRVQRQLNALICLAADGFGGSPKVNLAPHFLILSQSPFRSLAILAHESHTAFQRLARTWSNMWRRDSMRRTYTPLTDGVCACPHQRAATRHHAASGRGRVLRVRQAAHDGCRRSAAADDHRRHARRRIGPRVFAPWVCALPMQPANFQILRSVPP